MNSLMHLPNSLNLDTCPCQSGKAYENCCRPVHLDFYQALNAEQLMRSRYSAFAISSKFPDYQKFFEDYLLKTWHPDTRPASLNLDLTTQWIDLKIKGRKEGKKRHSTGKVHFIATFEDKLNPMNVGYLEEISQFEKDAKRGWLYVDGEIIHQ